MRVIKKIVILSVALWVLLTVFGGKTASIGNYISDLMKCIDAIAFAGISPIIQSIFK